MSNLSVVLAGSYNDESRSTWRVIIYVDEMGSEQQLALAGIFLRRASGETLKNFAFSALSQFKKSSLITFT